MAQPGIKYNKVAEQLVHAYEATCIKGGDEVDDNLIQGVVVKNKNTVIFRTKLIYARNVFKGKHNKLMAIVNGQGINDWCSSKG